MTISLTKNTKPSTSDVVSIWSTFSDSYQINTPKKVKVLDTYLLFTVISGALVFIYGSLTEATPYPSFLSGFISTIGSFVFAVNLRCQIVDSSLCISTERAVAQFLFCHIFLFLSVANFIS